MFVMQEIFPGFLRYRPILRGLPGALWRESHNEQVAGAKSYRIA